MKRRLLGIGVATVLLGSLAVSEARAEVSRVTLSVSGLACPFCAYGLEKKLKRVEGVQAVQTDLKTGVVTLQMAEGKSPDLAKIRSAVKDTGFTLQTIRLTAIGTLVVNGGRVLLKLRSAEGQYLLHEKEAGGAGGLTDATFTRLKKLAAQGAVVAVTGTVHEHAEDWPGLEIETLEVVRPRP